ncbi:mucoidy inhibitor MuiA family protein [Kitasatospora mediocidica]|uniref:mucoidy inhibitor MuiA family protein n=1 Tax=Kitasatospora mediocidica TaxID=58352 RepID=UPI00069225BC|nr:mucoidy inhibitor MuiA family protein [Kitasatospora mediocidica]
MTTEISAAAALTHPAAVPLPVTAVTCLEDRAHVERTTTVRLAPGLQRLRFGPITALAVDRSLRAELHTAPGTEPSGAEPPGATVLDARLTRTWTPRAPGPPGPDDSALLHRIDELEKELRLAEPPIQRLEARLALLTQLCAELLTEIGEGTGHGEAEPVRWSRELDRVEAEQDAYAEQLRAARARSDELYRQLQEAVAARGAAEAQPPELLAHVELTVVAPHETAAELTVSHLTPCALWRPAYRAAFTGAALAGGAQDAPGSLRLESDAMVWQRTGEDWTDVRLTLSTARSALAAEPPRLHEDVLTLRELSSGERRTLDVELREEEISALGPDGPQAVTADLPGVDDGGEVRVLRAPATATVPGDGRGHRVPLSAFTVPAAAELASAPELSPLVTEVVAFRNPADHPLLAGPVDLVRGSGFTGRGELRFTAAGAPAELAFGSTDGYRVLRETSEVRGSTGLAGLGQRTVLTRTVRVHVSRLSAPDEQGEQRITLRERIPVSEVSAVEVRLRTQECRPAPDEADAEGVLRWELSLPPGGRRTVTLVYEISASAKVAGL